MKHLFWLTAAALTAVSTSAQDVRTAPSPADKLGWQLAVHSYTFQRFSIYGTHLITSRTITLTPSSAKDEVHIEQYREFIL